MQIRRLVRTTLLVLAAAGAAGDAFATGVPVGGFLPLVGISLTDEFDTLDDELLFSVADFSSSPGGEQLGVGSPHYDLALLDTGANGSLLTNQSDAAFDLQSSGFRGLKSVTVGGATGFFDAQVSNPLGIYAAGVGNRTGSSPLSFNPASMVGQTSVSLLTLPPDSDLPNVLGLPFASQYATFIRNDQPQVFELNGRTVRTPQVEFLPLGSGGQGISRRAPILLQPGISFASPPAYIPDFTQIVQGQPAHLNPTSHTLHSDGVASVGGMFLSVDVENQGERLDSFNFFFDTGADVTVVSELNAARLGFDVILDEPEFTVAVVGSGGAKLEVPGFFVDEFVIETVGGPLVANNVPVIVLNVTNAASPGNVVDGIVGTNLLAGRNIVIDPDPSLGGGNLGPQLYIGDPVTTNRNWAAAGGSAAWTSGGSWTGGVPSLTGIANLRHVSGGNQEAVLATPATAYEANISGAGEGQKMTLRVTTGELTTYSGINIESFGTVHLQGGTLDTQYVDIGANAMLAGVGTIRTGSGPIPGQVENIRGTVAPGDDGAGTLHVVGRYSNGASASLEFHLNGTTAGVDFGNLAVDGPAALAGTVAVNLHHGYDPGLGDRFDLLTATEGLGGGFDKFALPATHAWLVHDNGFTLAIESAGWKDSAGDFDHSGQTVGDDLAVWEAGYAEATGFNGADFLSWQRGYGQGGGASAVPEPTGAILALAALALAGALGRQGDQPAAW